MDTSHGTSLHHDTTEAEEMYLITVARAIEDGDGPPVSVSAIASHLGVSPVSTNQMIKKLEGFGLVSYVPYKGVELTEEGERLANMVLRSRRLWGVFLVDHLGMSPAKADEVACEMEHVTPVDVAERLSSFLGDPTVGPQGKAIPNGPGDHGRHHVCLSDLAVGQTASIISASEPFADFLVAQGLVPGSVIELLARGADGSVIAAGGSGPIHLTCGAAEQVLVAAVPQRPPDA